MVSRFWSSASHSNFEDVGNGSQEPGTTDSQQSLINHKTMFNMSNPDIQSHDKAVSVLMVAFDFVSSPALSRLQAKVHEMPLLFAAFATIVYWTALFYYRGRTRKVITMAYYIWVLQAHCLQFIA